MPTSRCGGGVAASLQKNEPYVRTGHSKYKTREICMSAWSHPERLWELSTLKDAYNWRGEGSLLPSHYARTPSHDKFERRDYGSKFTGSQEEMLPKWSVRPRVRAF